MQKQQRSGVLCISIMLILALALVSPWGGVAAAAGGGGPYELTWYTVDGGGTYSAGGGYTLASTAGQPDAGLVAGGGYTLYGGFWAGGLVPYRLYLPLILRAAP